MADNSNEISEDLIATMDQQQIQLLSLLDSSTVELVQYLQKFDSLHEITARSPLISFDDLFYIKTHVVNALCTIPREVKIGLVTGRLLAQKYDLPPLFRKLDEIKLGRPSIGFSEPYTKIPVIYGIFHVNENRFPPTGIQYVKVIEACKKYAKFRGKTAYKEASNEEKMEFDNFAKIVDNLIPTGKATWLNSESRRSGEEGTYRRKKPSKTYATGLKRLKHDSRQ